MLQLDWKKNPTTCLFRTTRLYFFGKLSTHHTYSGTHCYIGHYTVYVCTYFKNIVTFPFYIAEARGDPVELTAFWYGLPANVDKVDAVYERQDHKIVFFAGKYFYVLAGNSQLEQGPTPLSYLGLPDDLDHIDAAMTWGYNGKTFFFSGE